MTALHWKLVIDANDPHAQAAFWAQALGYVVEDHSALIERLLAAGHASADQAVGAQGRYAWRDLAAVRHPDDPYDGATGVGTGRRLLFQRVPEAETVKNRLHLDLHTGPDRDREAEVRRLEWARRFLCCDASRSRRAPGRSCGTRRAASSACTEPRARAAGAACPPPAPALAPSAGRVRSPVRAAAAGNGTSTWRGAGKRCTPTLTRAPLCEQG